MSENNTSNTKYNAKIYNEKLPKTVFEPLRKFAESDCLLVPKSSKNYGLANKPNNCHLNVKEHVEKMGGTAINGWLLCRNQSIINAGIWMWAFHSVWLTDDNQLLDVTRDANYENCSFTTFLPDKTRRTNLDEGINYNNVVVFENARTANLLSQSLSLELQAGTLYWTVNQLRNIKKIDDHSGMYRSLRAEYPKNIDLIKKQYGVTIQNSRIVQSPANDEFSEDIFFDFSLSAA